MYRFLSLFVILISGSLCSQLSPKVSILVDQLSKFKRAESKHISIDGRESKVYKIYDSISKIASEREIEYLAFNGTPIIKVYFSKKLVELKSKKLKELFKIYIKSNDFIEVQLGCVVTTRNLANDLYLYVFYLPQEIKENNSWREALKSERLNADSTKHQIMDDEALQKILNYETKWSLKELENIIKDFDYIVLNDKNAPQQLVEYICLLNQEYEKNIPYYHKFIFFSEKYHSKIISNYIKFCRGY